MPMPMYRPPPLVRRVRVRNPGDRPALDANVFGRATSEPNWGIVVWAHRRDRSPIDRAEDDVEFREGSVVWTIRHRTGVASNAEVVYEGEVYESIGPPVERGGSGFGRLTRYLEIHTRLRK